MTLVFLDVETTGLDPARHEIWEIAYAVDDGPVQAAMVTHTGVGADPTALDVSGYWRRFASPDAVHGHRSMRFELELRELLTGATLVGANPRFDAAFLRARWGVESWRHRLLDIEAYAMGALGRDEPPSLTTIAELLNMQPGNHTAAEDVRCLRDCFRTLQQLYRDWDGDVEAVPS